MALDTEYMSFMLCVPNKPALLSVIVLSVIVLSVIVLSVVVLSVVVLSVVVLSVVVLSVIAAFITDALDRIAALASFIE
jgi:hypothetical protein